MAVTGNNSPIRKFFWVTKHRFGHVQGEPLYEEVEIQAKHEMTPVWAHR
jgi:hypothetical protein